MALRLRYQIDSPRRLREHVHLVDGAGYFFFPSAIAPKGTLASLEIDFSSTVQVALMRGWVWARGSAGGLWLELAGAQRCLRQARARSGAERDAAGERAARPGRARWPAAAALQAARRQLRGARLAAMPSDAGTPGQRIRVKLPEAGSSGHQLLAEGCVRWAAQGEIGVEWDRENLSSRVAVRRLLHNARHEWEEAKTALHPATCRCLGRWPQPSVILLG